MNHIEIHKKIEEMIATGVAVASVERLGKLIKTNNDARQYFYTRVEETWLDWLSTNSFFEAIKQKAEDPTRYLYTLPELEYLVRIAGAKPKEVTDIMLSVNVPDNFNPEVVDRFLWITQTLPAEDLSRMVKKIRDERWIPRMGNFNRWEFEYEKMFATLATVNNSESIIALAEAVLVVRPTEEVPESPRSSRDAPFYFDDISHTRVFDKLIDVAPEYTEKAFALVLKTLGDVVSLGGEKEDEVFPIGEIFPLFDVDFFTLEGGDPTGYSHREDVKFLAAAAKKLAEKLIGDACGTPTEAHRVYADNFKSLPDARTIWRFKLFVWSLCPEVFKKELKMAFFRVFDVGDNFWAIVAGAEYERALQKAFNVLTDGDKGEKREYVRKMLELSSTDRGRDYGYEILSSVFNELTPDERNKAETLFGKALNPEHKPQPSIGRSYSGTVVPQTPPGSDDEWAKPVPEIVDLMKTKWIPKVLEDQYKGADFLRPISAEGIATRLQEEIKKRPADYIAAAELFFDRRHLDQHYTYSFIRGVYDAYKAGTFVADTDWSSLMRLLENIVSEGKREEYGHEARRDDVVTWLSNWDGVHNALADLAKELIGENEDAGIPFDENRNALLSIVEYLLAYPNPQPKKHEVPQKDVVTGKEQYTTSDPFTEAINSVRGKAFQALTLFIYRDGKKYDKDATVRIDESIKKLYEDVLSKEDTEALMFEFGHYLPSFYYRDTAWITSLLPKIFPKEKHDLFLAAWEGYLTSNLYRELFDLLAPYYDYTVSLKPEQYTPRRYFNELDEALATHIALASMHYAEFGTDAKLFKTFWSTPNAKRHEAFVSFVGRHALSRDSAKEWGEKQGIKAEKLKELWDWILEHCDEESVFADFGFWMNAEAGIFEIPWLAEHTRRTLEKSKGVVDWEYALMKSLPEFVKVAPKDALAIVRLYLMAMVDGTQRRGWLHIDSEMVVIFKELYRNPDPIIKKETYDLINELLPRGSGQFWPLKDALE